MSQENVEAFRRAIAAGNSRDVEAVLEECDPAVEFRPALETMLGGEATVYRGHEGIREFFRDADEAFTDLHVEVFEVRDLGDRLVASCRMGGRGKASGIETGSPVTYVVDFTNGKGTRVWTYLDLEEALKAAGLEE